MFTVTCFTAVFSKEILMPAAWRWRDNNAETCGSYV